MLYAAVRGVIFIALLLLIGTQVAASLVKAQLSAAPDLAAPLQEGLRGLLRKCVLALICFCLIKGVLQLFSFIDPGESVTLDLTKSVLLSGTWGISWLVQLGTIVVFVVINGKRPRTDSRLTLLIIAAQTGMGHAAGSSWPNPVGRIVDMGHITGLGIWLGTLAALTIIAFPMLRGDERLPDLAAVVRAFSLYARIGVSLVIVSGITAALVYAGPLATIAQSTWGRLLLVKLALMLGVLGLGWYNWRIVTPALDCGDTKSRKQLRNAVRAELLLGLAMLIITTMLVASPLPGEG